MTDATVVAVDPPPATADFNSGLSIPPLDTSFLSHHLIGDDGGNQNDTVPIDDLDFDFSFDDFGLPFSDDLDGLFNPNQLQKFDSVMEHDLGFHNPQFAPNFDKLPSSVFKSSPEMRHLSGGGGDGDHVSNGSGVLDSSSPVMECNQISGYLDVPSPESNGSNRRSLGNCDADGKGLNCSAESGGSRDCGSNLSENWNNRASRSVSSSPDSSNSSIRVGVVDQKIKLEVSANNDKVNSSLLKRKKESEDSAMRNNVESRTSKYRKSNCNVENDLNPDSNGGLSEDDEKRKARLMRNRESAQLSRQRKKHYVEELEDKVKNMHATIQDLNAKISYFMAENVTLRQQVGNPGAAGGVPPPPIAPPPPGMYPHPAMMYPWMPCAPPYMMKPQGSQVPLVPIPRLKPQQPAPAPKVSKKADSKKSEGPKTKKVAGVSFLGLLFFIMLFGGLVPMVNVRFGGVREAFTGIESNNGGGLYEKHRGRVLMVNGTEYGEEYGGRREYSGNSSVHWDQRGNRSEPLVASLYVPRNDKLVKIDGNLIIHSVLASEKAMATHGKEGGETGLAVPQDLSPAIPVAGVVRNGARHPLLRALGSGSGENDDLKSTATDGELQQWFREGLAGPMLSSGMCTEVFQFDVSSAIVPATASRNISEEHIQNSTHLSKGRNRRILHGLPIQLPESSHNNSREHAGSNSHKEKLNGDKNVSSMVVSVLVDPREAGDADVDGVMGKKSLSRIFVVVLIDSVKYVTYSCMLPFMGTPHLVTA